MLGHASCTLKKKKKMVGGHTRRMAAKLLSYWTNTDCNTALGDMDPHVIHSYCQNFNIRSEYTSA